MVVINNFINSLVNGFISIGETAFVIAVIISVLMVFFYHNDEISVKTKATQCGILYGIIIVVGIILAGYVKANPNYDALVAILYMTAIIAVQICTIAYPIRKWRFY